MTFPFGWRRRAQLTINATAVTGSGGALSDFPVLLREGDLPAAALDPDAYVQAQMDGGDLRVTADKAGTWLLETEIFLWDQTARKAVVWVKVPSLAQDSDTSLWVWWGSEETETLPAATVLDNVLGANAQPEQAWAGQVDYLRRDPRGLLTAVAIGPRLIVDLKRLEATQADGSRVALTALPGFSYSRAGRTTVCRDGETRIVEAGHIPVGDTGYAPQTAAFQLLGNDPLNLLTAAEIGVTASDTGSFQIFRRVEITSDGLSSGRLAMAGFGATAEQPFSVQWYFQPGSSGQAFLEVINSDSLAAGRLSGPVGDLALMVDAGFGALSNIRTERLADDVWRVSATVTPAETASYRIGLGPNSATVGESIIGLAMGAQAEAVPTALIPDAGTSRGADLMQITGFSGLAEGTLAMAATAAPLQVSGFPRAISLSDGTFSEDVSIGLYANGPAFFTNLTVAGTVVDLDGEGSWTGYETGVRTWRASDTHHWADSANGAGSAVLPAPSGLNTMSIGSRLGFGTLLGEVAWVALWDTALDELDVKRLRRPGWPVAELGIAQGMTVGASAFVAPPGAAEQAALEIETWDATGELVSVASSPGVLDAGTRLALSPQIPAAADWLRYRLRDVSGTGNGFGSKDAVLRRESDISPPIAESDERIATRRANEYEDGFLTPGAVISIVSARIAVVATGPVALLTASLRLLAQGSVVAGRLHVVAASGVARVRGSGIVTLSGHTLVALAKLLTRTGGRRIDAADGLPLNSRIYGRRTRRVRAATPDN